MLPIGPRLKVYEQFQRIEPGDGVKVSKTGGAIKETGVPETNGYNYATYCCFKSKMPRASSDSASNATAQKNAPPRSAVSSEGRPRDLFYGAISGFSS